MSELDVLRLRKKKALAKKYQTEMPKEIGVLDAFFPETVKMIEETVAHAKDPSQAKPESKRGLHFPLEAISSIGRFFSVMMFEPAEFKTNIKGKKETAEQRRQRFLKAIQRKTADKDAGPIQKTSELIMRDPASGAIIATTPITGPLFTMSVLAGGAAEGLISALTHQIENYANGQPVSLKSGLMETGLAALIPGFVKTGGKGLQSAGKHVVKRPMPKKTFKQTSGSKPKIEDVFEYGLDDMRGLRAMERKTRDYITSVNRQYKPALAKLKNETVSPRVAFREASVELMGEINKKRHGDERLGIGKGMEFWDNYLKDLGADEVGVGEALSIRRAVQNLAHFDKMNASHIKGSDRFARKFAEKLNKQFDKYPKIRELDKKLHKTKPFDPDAHPDQGFAGAQAERIDKLNLTEKMALMGAVGFGGYGAIKGGRGEEGLPLLGLMAASRFGRLPGTGSGMYRLGSQMATQGPKRRGLGGLIRRGVGTQFRGGE